MDKNYNDKERSIGFEIEYAGLSLEDVAGAVVDLFGGVIKKNTSALYKVEGTGLGDFTLELDALPLQKLAESNEDYKTSDEIGDRIQYQLGKTVGKIGAEVAPYEIICPPVKLSQIGELETLCYKLRDLGAEGTKASFRYAFGLHINPEVKSLEADYILHHVQSFLLLASWLKDEHDVNISRRLTKFIDPFPNSYYELVLDPDYGPDLNDFIKDYHKHNPSRNRALDMLPLFAFINERLVRELYGEEEKINKRPTFHYRLPNCEIDRKEWSLNKEWQRWLIVEKIAGDSALLKKLMDKWTTYHKKLIATDLGWMEEVKGWLEKNLNIS
ncbi:MAG: amidoligase family protein [Alphaproteobacteria bacterium]|nr:amidoligase family protein [Alphaproteobacteria bacterium]HPF45323.1 amidoligase family protein [Emcibacteraceae bacterium]HRW29852.1 amidoligase family protein [Emcibacteraceae bacterium]